MRFIPSARGIAFLLGGVILSLSFYSSLPFFWLMALFFALLPLPLIRFSSAESSIEVANTDRLIIDKASIIAKSEVQEIIPAVPVSREELAKAAYLAASLHHDQESRVILQYVEKAFPSLVERIKKESLTAQSVREGVRIAGHLYQKGSRSYMERLVADTMPHDLESADTMIARQGSTPILIAKDERIIGVIAIRQYVDAAAISLCNHLRNIEVKTVVIGCDSKLALSSIAKQVGCDEYVAEISRESKEDLIENHENKGFVVKGDKELKSIAQRIGEGRKELRQEGALSIFLLTSVAARSILLFPSLLIPFYPAMKKLDVLHLSTPLIALSSAILYNLLLTFFLVPLIGRLEARRVFTSMAANAFLWLTSGLMITVIGIKTISMLLRGF